MNDVQLNDSCKSKVLEKGVVVGVNGVHLKRFERVLVNVLPHIQPAYVKLPVPPSIFTRDLSSANAGTFCCIHTERDSDTDAQKSKSSDWPYDRLPPAARVWGSLPGQLNNRTRADRKEQQVRSILSCVFALIPTSTLSLSNDNQKEIVNFKNSFSIVDMGGGSGHLAIPLALLLLLQSTDCGSHRTCRFRVLVVDLRGESLQLLHRKAEHCWQQMNKDHNSTDLKLEALPLAGARVTAIPNLFTFHGPIQALLKEDENTTDIPTASSDRLPTFHFDLGVALHLCGQVTDVALRLCGQHRAALVMAPCCVGKINSLRNNPYTFQATGSNICPLTSHQYPQSSVFAKHITQVSDWNSLAQAADYSAESKQECRMTRNAARRVAKGLLETDRILYLKEFHGYEHACLTRMQPWEATPKNDIILAWNDDNHSNNPDGDLMKKIDESPDEDCFADVAWTMQHLLATPIASSDLAIKKLCGTENVNDSSLHDSVDWTWQEEQEVREKIKEFLLETAHDHSQKLVFPVGCKRRQRKLIHYVAEQFDLAHWCVGKKDSERTVCVARRLQQRENSSHAGTA